MSYGRNPCDCSGNCSGSLQSYGFRRLRDHRTIEGLDTWPVRILKAWLETGGIASGPVFGSINRHRQLQPSRLAPADVARIVKKLALRAGLDAAKYAGHSLRAGHATAATVAGASERSIMAQTGHRFSADDSSGRIVPGSWGCSSHGRIVW